MYKTYVCSSLFWEVPHHLIVNVYYIHPPIQCWEGSINPPPHSMLGEVRRADQSPNQHWMGGGVKLEQMVMYVHWIQVNGSLKNRIRYTLFAGNIFPLIQVNGFRMVKTYHIYI